MTEGHLPSFLPHAQNFAEFFAELRTEIVPKNVLVVLCIPLIIHALHGSLLASIGAVQSPFVTYQLRGLPLCKNWMDEGCESALFL
jgi:hypothetical protein